MSRRDRRADIMRAAEKLFTSRRYHEIVLDDVIQEAKVGKGTIYRYFRNKEDLFFQTASSGFEELCELIARKDSEDGPFDQQLVNVCRRISEFFAKRRQLLRMMQSEDARMPWHGGKVRQRWRQQRRKLVSAVGQIIQKGVREGRVRSDVPTEVLAGFLLGMLRTRARTLTDVPVEARPVGLVVDLFCHGAGQKVDSIEPAHADSRE